MYYFLIAISTVLFGIQSFLQKRYQQKEGKSFYKSVVFTLCYSAASAVIMFILSKGKVEFTLFSFVLAAVSSANSILSCYCSVVALSQLNLSLYSLFQMLGGMLLPFIFGVVCYGEGMDVKKTAAIILLIISLLISSSLKTESGVLKYCFAVFSLNGLNGVISKLHQSNTEQRISESGYMLLINLLCIAACTFILFICLRDKREKLGSPAAAVGYMAGYGAITGTANFLVLIALLHIKASVQYPMITGGTIIISTIIALVSGEKPGLKNYVSMIIAVAATILLV